MASVVNQYEAQRQARIRHNAALIAELKMEPLVETGPRKASSTTKAPAAKRRKIEVAPSRTSARIANAPSKPTYNEDDNVAITARGTTRKRVSHAVEEEDEIEEGPLVPKKNVEETIAGWTAWTPVAPPPTRDEETKEFHFADHPLFTPNKSPEEMLREGAFGGSYYRPLRSRKLGVQVQDDWKELPAEWLRGLDVELYLTSSTYELERNKYRVACGQSIEEWEASGWIDHEFDVRGWFQWYTRFWQGRRCADDERQVARWKKCVGPTGRWRRALLKKYLQRGVREVFDDGEDEDEDGGAKEVSPVVHQTCHHWAFEVRQQHLDEAWACL